MRGIHWSPVDPPHKGQWFGALMFSLICAWTNSWANNRDVDDLRRHRAHYDVTVMTGNLPATGGFPTQKKRFYITFADIFVVYHDNHLNKQLSGKWSDVALMRRHSSALMLKRTITFESMKSSFRKNSFKNACKMMVTLFKPHCSNAFAVGSKWRKSLQLAGPWQRTIWSLWP